MRKELDNWLMKAQLMVESQNYLSRVCETANMLANRDNLPMHPSGYVLDAILTEYERMRNLLNELLSDPIEPADLGEPDDHPSNRP